ncbi:MAG: hypothetical protein O3A13_06570 [Proteobacteria bacterium]|nr:hypothetical protein [Pseudomonadota bacterium]MDA0993281.1 hypothetical protein [Pseudomonadota bacterium]
MDEFEKRLKRDAQAISADVSPELKARIDASLRGTERVAVVSARKSAPTQIGLASSLTGLAAVIVLVVIANLGKQGPDPIPEISVAGRTEPLAPIDFPLILPDLKIDSAQFTSPLEEELLKLRADIKKARNNVKEDIDFTF